MKKGLTFLMIGLILMAAGTTTGYAQKAKKQKYVPTAKHAIHELQEAKVVLAKLTPDAAGHTVKAVDLINQAEAELTEI